jgi:alpha-galactosidase
MQSVPNLVQIAQIVVQLSASFRAAGYTQRMTIKLSNSQLTLTFQSSDKRLYLREWMDKRGLALPLLSYSSLFGIEIDNQRFDVNNLRLDDFKITAASEGIQHGIASFSGDVNGNAFVLEHHTRLYENTALVELWQVVHAVSDQPVTVTRLDSYVVDVPAKDYELLWFTSQWGQEFEPVLTTLNADSILESRAGRSSNGTHPYFALFDGKDGVLAVSVAWSGNWICRFEKMAEGIRLSGGIHDWEFSKALTRGETVESAHVMLALGHNLNDVSQQFAKVGRQHWYPHNALSRSLPVEWNHWWSYEDLDITEALFLENVEAAARLGIEVCTLDAGWFGSSDTAAEWYHYRGDWHRVNTERFPNGIRAIADAVHAAGMKFGIWCEIEALGEKADLVADQPQLAAMRDGEQLGYVCFGNPDAQEWAFDVLSRLITEYHADWIKLDFNLDPKAGCNRTDHGHQAGDGMLAHYEGYYHVLNRVRETYPEVVLENCSSGGLRVDLGILQHAHTTFLSDTDWPLHSLQVFWGASLMLAPDVCLRWSFSEWRHDKGPVQQNFNPRDPAMTQHQFDTYIRIAMMSGFGLSQKLPLLPEWVAQRLAWHIQVYRQYVRQFVRDAVFYRLTEQPRRDDSGDRWCAFQYRLPDDSSNLMFVFRLPGGEATRTIRLFDLDPERVYQITGFDGESFGSHFGADLMSTGIVFNQLPEEGSALMKIEAAQG